MGEKGAKLKQCYKKHIFFSNWNKAKYHHHHTTQKPKSMYKKTYYQMQRAIQRAVFYFIVALILANLAYQGYKWATSPELPTTPKNTTNSNK